MRGGDGLSGIARVALTSVTLVAVTWYAVYVIPLTGWLAVGTLGALVFPAAAFLFSAPYPTVAQYAWNALVATVAVPVIISFLYQATNELDLVSIFLLLALAMSLPALVGIVFGGLVVKEVARRRHERTVFGSVAR